MPTFRLAPRLGVIALATAALLGPVAVGASAAAGASAGVAASAAVVTPAKGILPSKDPTRNVNPSPNFLTAGSCANGGDSVTCNSLVRRAIAHARTVLEKIGVLSFANAAYEKLTPDEQLFVSANLERTERGEAAIVVLTKSLDTIAQIGANNDEDPPLGQVPAKLPGGGRLFTAGGNWAGGFDNALGSDYGWMYDDKGSAWGHRNNILAHDAAPSWCTGRHEIAMGAGHVAKGKAFGDSESELIAGVCGATPTDVVMTWAKAKQLLHIT
jgi:hypothetical protein